MEIFSTIPFGRTTSGDALRIKTLRAKVTLRERWCLIVSRAAAALHGLSSSLEQAENTASRLQLWVCRCVVKRHTNVSFCTRKTSPCNDLSHFMLQPETRDDILCMPTARTRRNWRHLLSLTPHVIPAHVRRWVCDRGWACGCGWACGRGWVC